jgi:hypothetical protein
VRSLTCTIMLAVPADAGRNKVRGYRSGQAQTEARRRHQPGLGRALARKVTAFKTVPIVRISVTPTTSCLSTLLGGNWVDINGLACFV